MALLVATVVIIAIMGVVGFYALRSAAFISPHESAPAYDPDEALSFVWSEIPADVRERLGHEAVGLVLAIELEYMKQAGAVVNGKQKRPPAKGLVIGAPETVDFIIEQASELGVEVSPDDVHAIIEAEAEYLMAIGAIGEATQ